jgi:RNA polymerase sigma factor (sigma-70 family)
MSEPPEFKTVFDKPGPEWTPDERTAVLVWLNTSPQLRYWLGHTAKHLGWGTRADDAEDTWFGFNAHHMDYTIEHYDPDRGRRFPSFLRMRLEQVCWRQGDKIRARREQPLERENEAGESIQIEVADPNAPTESELLRGIDTASTSVSLARCLQTLRPGLQRVILLELEGNGDREIAQELRITEQNVRIRRFRAIRDLRKCLGL